MLDEEKLKTIKEVQDRLIYVYDQFRFNSKTHYDHELTQAFMKTKESIQILNNLAVHYLKDMPNCFEVVVLQDTIIENQDTVELKTNITGKHFEDEDIEIVFNGYIPSDGYITLSYQEQEWGMEILAKNNVPTSALEGHGLAGYHYCDPTTTRYFSPGIYKIDRGTTIGFCIVKEKEKQKTKIN